MEYKYIIIACTLSVLLCAGYYFIRVHQNSPGAHNLSSVPPYQYTAVAYFAGGCFWCVESDFEKLEGVGDVVSGYSGGTTPNPTYQNHADHREAVRVHYDPTIVSYRDLVHYFFRHHDGTDAGGSFYDRGHSYTSAIYYTSEQEREIAQEVVMNLNKHQLFAAPLVTSIEAFRDFTVAEDYHQNYYRRDALSATKYKYYRAASGRDNFINQTRAREQELTTAGVAVPGIIDTAGDHAWADFEKPNDEELKRTLSPLAYRVTQRDATEQPFSEGNLNDEERDGIFVDIVSGEPLYASVHKYKSGTGWPSFTQPIDPEFVVTKQDYKLILPRTEVRSTYADSHLGHVFNDGPETLNGQPSTGQRWCMNGAAMRFVPLENMENEGYGDYLYLFVTKD